MNGFDDNDAVSAAPKRPEVGCTDSGCPASAPGGMRTNAGCRCDVVELRRAAAAWKAYALELERRGRP